MTLAGRALTVSLREVPVWRIDGSRGESIELPNVFSSELRPTLVRRVYEALATHRLQPKGAWRGSGHKYTVESMGPGHGIARIARITARGTGKASAGGFIPTAVGGRPTHPPVPEKRIHKRINEKEKRAALLSAVAFTSSREWVAKRGHRVPDDLDLPIVVEDALESLTRTREAIEALQRLGLGRELDRCREKKVRPGRGKMRGRRYKRRVGPLIVVNRDGGIGRAAGNIGGVEVVAVKDLSVLDLSPGGIPGRLTIYTRSALEALRGLM